MPAIPAHLLERRARSREPLPHLPQLHVMVAMLKGPRVWAQLEPIQQLIVLAAEQTAHLDVDAPPDKRLRYLRAVGAMFDVFYYADSINFSVTTLVDEVSHLVP